jgi:hypothetical protein
MELLTTIVGTTKLWKLFVRLTTWEEGEITSTLECTLLKHKTHAQKIFSVILKIAHTHKIFWQLESLNEGRKNKTHNSSIKHKTNFLNCIKQTYFRVLILSMDSNNPLLASMILNATTFLHWCNNTMMFNTHFQIIHERRTPCSCYLKFSQNSQMLLLLNPKPKLEAYPCQVWTWGLNQLLFKHMTRIQSWVNSGYNYLKYVNARVKRQVGLQILKHLGMKWGPNSFRISAPIYLYIYIYIYALSNTQWVFLSRPHT